MSDVQLKCPSCGAPINFDVPSGKMKCGFCGAAFTVEEVNQFNGISQANAELAAAHAQQVGTAGAAGGAGPAATPGNPDFHHSCRGSPRLGGTPAHLSGRSDRTTNGSIPM
ncbi:hypothetical protein [Mobiluncus curtisii]|uniref:hypothetical protein n=1 Tax=Mobiluncus curtisii TaxID=2051 RepID=UPI002092C6EC|nr:hypothetical protein [Mobiluncus curtisii]